MFSHTPKARQTQGHIGVVIKHRETRTSNDKDRREGRSGTRRYGQTLDMHVAVHKNRTMTHCVKNYTDSPYNF
jgi:hypothetical protein